MFQKSLEWLNHTIFLPQVFMVSHCMNSLFWRGLILPFLIYNCKSLLETRDAADLGYLLLQSNRSELNKVRLLQTYNKSLFCSYKTLQNCWPWAISSSHGLLHTNIIDQPTDYHSSQIYDLAFWLRFMLVKQQHFNQKEWQIVLCDKALLHYFICSCRISHTRLLYWCVW